jgi:hypothetical protein
MPLFEVELDDPKSIPKLQATVPVKGNVKTTPRYDARGYAWVHGEWVANIWFDKSLEDRFIFEETNRNAAIGAGVGGIAGALAGYLITKNPLYALVGIPGALVGAAVGYYTAKPR